MTSSPTEQRELVEEEDCKEEEEEEEDDDDDEDEDVEEEEKEEDAMSVLLRKLKSLRSIAILEFFTAAAITVGVARRPRSLPEEEVGTVRRAPPAPTRYSATANWPAEIAARSGRRPSEVSASGSAPAL